MTQVNISPATGHQLYKHTYKPLTVASLDFGEFLVDRFIECEKSDKWKRCFGEGFLRLAALDFPAYGRCFIKSAAFFVPYYQVLQNIDGFRSNLVADKGQACVMPNCKADFLNMMLGSNGSYSTTVVNPQSVDDYDFTYCSNNTGTAVFAAKRLTYKGKRIYKFFKSLGYDFTMYSSYTTQYQDVMDVVPPVNILNFICFLKVYIDYFVSIHLYQNSMITSLLRAIKDGNDFSVSGQAYYDASTGLMSVRCIESCYVNTLLPFESNMYTNAWNSENSPLGDISNQKVLHSNSLIGPHLPSFQNSGSYGTSDSVSETTSSVYLHSLITLSNAGANLGHPNMNALTPFGLNSMYALWDFVKRNNLAGSEPARQALARFGIKGDDINAMFVRKLFEASEEIDFSAVLSNSNTYDSNTQEGSVLGAYAGVGLSPLKFDYNYQCSDYGLIINLSWLNIDPLQLRGFDPSVLRIRPFDWYTPQYDGKGIRAIPNMEVAAGTKVNNLQGNEDASVFGFVGLYDEMRQMRDVVLGDFVFGNARKFVFSRDFTHQRDTNTLNVLKPQNVAVQTFNRWGTNKEVSDPFQFDITNGDRFYLQIKWTFESERSLLSLSESLDLQGGEGDIALDTASSPNA